MYKILPYSYTQAKKLGVTIKASNRNNKKIDVYKNGKYLLSIGDKNYLDYPYYKKYYGKDIAEYKRNNYWIRHRNNAYKYGSAGYYAARILW